MKTKNFFWRAMYMCMAAMMACVINVSCSSDDPIVPDPTPDADNGEVSFEISNDGGTGTGTSTSPAEVSKGDTLNMVITQKSSYTDSDGTVFECEPKATIELFAKLDTVYVEDLSQLTNVQEKPEVQTSTDGQDPVVNEINQKFLIGEQYVNFDLAYEVYTYRTIEGKTIEMPYVKLNQANLGSSNATEETKSSSEAVVKSITVKPLPQTRASVSDTTWYEVNAVFNLDIECMNAKTENKQNLTFSVTYMGAVTTEIELGEPVKELSSTIEVLSGTNSTSSPFVANTQEVMSLLFKQNSSYIDSYGNKMSCEPEAKIRIFAQADTIYATKKEELEGTPASHDFVFTASGEDPVLYSAVQLFELGVQHIQLEMSYEVYTAKDIENKEITMPYLKQNATITGAATVNELSTVTSSKADTTFYEVKVPIKLETIDVETADENIQTIELVVSYIGAVVTLKEVPELVRVEYRTGYVWEEAHDNLPLLYYAKVYRDRYYSNGEVFTDEFVDNGHPVGSSAYIDPVDYFPGKPNWIDEDVMYNEYNQVVTDSVWSFYHSTTVPDLSKLRIGEPIYDGYTGSAPGEWDNYHLSKTYSDDLQLYDILGVPTTNKWESASVQSGWYFVDTTHQIVYIIYYGDNWIAKPTLLARFYDQSLVIDGIRITFLDHLPEHTWNFYTEQVTGGIKYVYECKTKFLGRNFYISAEETFYQK